MKFIDEVKIYVKAGNGGPGASHFRREKYVPLGGPDGGNGGKGGTIYIQATKNKNTLLDYSFKREWTARNGQHGGKQLSDGVAGENIVLMVPIGTQVFDPENNLEAIYDLTQDGQKHTLVKGGKGGKGNAHFKSPTNRAPEYAQPGIAGEEANFVFSLKLLADVGLVGLPNAGKSTFISVISAARPKIADYPFTTLTPNLGVVQAKGGSTYTVADVPGLIPGAHEGKGLGKSFLKHLERTKILLHMLDVSACTDKSELLDDFKKIQLELQSFSEELSSRKTLVVLTKIDALSDPEIITELTADLKELGLETYAISSATRSGLEEVLDKIQLLLINSEPIIDSNAS